MDNNSLCSPSLLVKMRILRDSLSKSEQQVVDYIIDHPQEIIYLSVAGLAESSQVSDATVIRTCRKLGMSGYQDLKINLAQDLVTPLQNIHEEVCIDDSASAILNKVFQSTIYTLNFTHDTINVSAIEAAANLLIQANRICIFGLGNSHAIAIDQQHKLMRLGLHATAYTDSHLQAIEASYLKKGDAVFAISHSGSSRDIVDSCKLARKNGASIISLTNMGASPLSHQSDIELHTASRESHYRIVALSSRIAQIAIIDTLYTIIAMRKPDIVNGFHELEKALQQKKY